MLRGGGGDGVRMRGLVQGGLLCGGLLLSTQSRPAAGVGQALAQRIRLRRKPLLLRQRLLHARVWQRFNSKVKGLSGSGPGLNGSSIACQPPLPAAASHQCLSCGRMQNPE